MPMITVDERYCKGCGLCITFCPRECIELDPNKLTAKGYHPARLKADANCSGCSTCATMCPDVAITVYR